MNFKMLQWLSIDVVIGAVISSAFIALILNVSMPLQVILTLAFSVWLIYTFDHLCDVSGLNRPASTSRHRFHQRYYKELSLIWMAIFICDVVLLFMIPPRTLYFGIALTALVILYFFCINILKQKKWSFKEISGAFLYTSGIFIGPVSLVSAFDWAWLILFSQFFMLASMNLIIFSLFDKNSDQTDGFPSIARAKKESMLYNYVIILWVLVLILWAVYAIVSDTTNTWIILVMGGSLLVLLFFRKYFTKNNRYRLAGDLVFVYPIAVLL